MSDHLSDPWARLLVAVLHSDKIDRSRRHLCLRRTNQHISYHAAAKDNAIKLAIQARRITLIKTEVIMTKPTNIEERIVGSALDRLVVEARRKARQIYADMAMAEARQGPAGGAVQVNLTLILSKRGPTHANEGQIDWTPIYHPVVKLPAVNVDENEPVKD